MRILKLVIWDLDETILTGILEEGDEEINPAAGEALAHLTTIGVLQALATQNQAETIETALEKFNWGNLFVDIEVDLGPKVRKVKRILDKLEINPADIAFVDEDRFEREAMMVQVPGLTGWSIAELRAYLDNNLDVVTEEGRRRPQMYLEQQQRTVAEETASDYTEFLRSCHIQITTRPYLPADAGRIEELLTRTHRMNLGVLPVNEAIARLNQPAQRQIVAELKDDYGDMGRCGIIDLRIMENGEAFIESLAISCRTRARGLSQAMLVSLLRHPQAKFQRYRCRYVSNGFNRPLRMLLMGAGFKPQPNTDELVLEAKHLAGIALPDWVNIHYQPISTYDEKQSR